MKPIQEPFYSYLNYNSATNHNSKFNANIESLLEDYFSPNELKNYDDYILVGNYREDLAKDFTSDSDNKIEITEQIQGVELASLDFFSPYEKMLFSHFFHGKLTTYIISGAMGSGKTTTLNYIFKKALTLEKYKNTFDVRLDFARGYGNAGSTIDEILSLFHDDFYKKIKAELIERIEEYNLSADFLRAIKQKHQYFSDFYDLSFEILERSQKVWNEYSEKEKVFEIFKYIENETQKGSISRLNLVMYFIGFIKDVLNDKGILIIFVYDNIDKLQPVAQRAIFINVLSLNAIASVKMVFTMRRSTKAKMDKVFSREETPLFENRAQYPYAHIYHHGPSVSKVYKFKLEKLISEIDDIKLFSHLDSLTKNNIVKRAKEIVKQINQNSIFKHAFNGISGQSKRLALTLANRPFCNNIINFDEDPNNLQSIVRTVYSGLGENMRIAIDDKYVCNVFSNKFNHFTLINYFILYIIDNYSTDKNLSYLKNVKNLYDFLYNYLEYSVEEILSSLNYLLSDKRALLGGEFYPKYNSLEDLIRLKDNLRITELGDRYLNSLTMNGSIYNQVCLLSLKWKDLNVVHYKNDSIAERFADLRFCISKIREEEDMKFRILNRNSQIFKKDIKLYSISNNIIKLLGNTLLGILSSLDLRDALRTEVLEWKNLIILINYTQGNLDKEEREFDKYCKQHGIS